MNASTYLSTRDASKASSSLDIFRDRVTALGHSIDFSLINRLVGCVSRHGAGGHRDAESIYRSVGTARTAPQEGDSPTRGRRVLRGANPEAQSEIERIHDYHPRARHRRRRSG